MFEAGRTGLRSRASLQRTKLRMRTNPSRCTTAMGNAVLGAR